jgi:hypothetical protein
MRPRHPLLGRIHPIRRRNRTRVRQSQTRLSSQSHSTKARQNLQCSLRRSTKTRPKRRPSKAKDGSSSVIEYSLGLI